MKSLPVVFLYVFFSVSSVSPAEPTALKKILMSSREDMTVKAQQEKTGCLHGSFLGIPFINDIELRMRNDEFDENRIRYEVRVKPKGIGETKALYRYNRTQFEQTKQNNDLLFDKALKERYSLFIDMVEQVTLLQLYDELIAIFGDKIKVMEQKTYSADFNFNNLIEAEDENTRLCAQRFDIQKMIAVFKDRAAFYLNDSSFAEFDTSSVISVDSVIAQTERTVFTLDTNNVYLQNYRFEFQIAQARFELEKAQSRRYMSHIGFAYDNGNEFDEFVRRNEGKAYNLDKAYMISIGFRIPDLTLSRMQINMREADFISDKEKYAELKRSLNDQLKKDLADIRSLIDQYRFLKARENEVDATSSLKKYLEMSGIDPLMLLLTKESIVKNRIAMAKVRFNVLRNFVEVLDASGKLSGRPLVNYISQTREAME